MWIVILLAAVVGGFLLWVVIPWLWAHVSIGGGLLLSGSLLAGTPVTPDGQVVRNQAPPAPVTVVAPAPLPVATSDPEADLRVAVVVKTLTLEPDRTESSPPVPPVMSPPCIEFNEPVIIHPQRDR